MGDWCGWRRGRRGWKCRVELRDDGMDGLGLDWEVYSAVAGFDVGFSKNAIDNKMRITTTTTTRYLSFFFSFLLSFLLSF